MTIDDNYFLAAVAGHLVCRFLQERKLHVAAVGDRSRFMAGLGDLSKIIFREDQRVFQFSGMKRGVANLEQVRAERKVWTVLFQNAEREQASSLGAVDAFTKVGGGKLFPVD